MPGLVYHCDAALSCKCNATSLPSSPTPTGIPSPSTPSSPTPSRNPTPSTPSFPPLSRNPSPSPSVIPDSDRESIPRSGGSVHPEHRRRACPCEGRGPSGRRPTPCQPIASIHNHPTPLFPSHSDAPRGIWGREEAGPLSRQVGPLVLRLSKYERGGGSGPHRPTRRVPL